MACSRLAYRPADHPRIGQASSWAHKLISAKAKDIIDKIDISPESEIRAIVNTRINAVRDKNLKAAMVPVAPDVVSFDVVNPLHRNGSEQLTERAEAWFSSFDGPIGFEVRNLVVVAGPDTAYSHSLNRYSGAKLNGERIDMWVRVTTGYRRIAGRWVITHEHSSVPFDTESGRASLDLKP